MAYKKVDEDSLISLADAIRNKNNSNEPLNFPDGFIEAISKIDGNNFNVICSMTPPEDTSALWIKTDKNIDKIETTENFSGEVVFYKDYATLPTVRQFDDSCISIGKKIYTFGGWNNDGISEIQCYNTDTQEISVIASFDEKINAPGVARIGNIIYIFGGYGWTTANCINKVKKFNTEDNTIEELDITFTARENFSAVAIGDNIYLIGGVCGSTQIKNIEVFNTKTLEVITLTPQYNYPQGCRARTWGDNIIIKGGWGNDFGSYQVLDIKNNKINSLGFNIHTAQFTSFNTIGNILFESGGSGYSGSQISYISYRDYMTGNLSQIKAYPNGACKIGNAKVGNKIYFIGGCAVSSNTCINNIHMLEVNRSLEKNCLLLELTNNPIYAIDSNTYVQNVYIGNDSNKAEYVEALLYIDNQWQYI